MAEAIVSGRQIWLKARDMATPLINLVLGDQQEK
jgi:hypothetical protein